MASAAAKQKSTPQKRAGRGAALNAATERRVRKLVQEPEAKQPEPVTAESTSTEETSVLNLRRGQITNPLDGTLLTVSKGSTTLVELDKLVRTFKGTKTLVIDPAGAAFLLRGNIYHGESRTNRNLSMRRVERFAQDMRDGNWRLTGEPIIMSDTGVLNTGQHRLSAVILYGQGLAMDVRFGIAREAVAYTDTGKSQSAADLLYKSNVQESWRVAAAARFVAAYKDGDVETCYSRSRSSNATILQIVQDYPELTQVTAMLSTLTWAPKARTGAIDALGFFALRASNSEKMMEFMNIVASGATGNLSNPARALYEKLINTDPKPRGTLALALGIKAWNAWTQGETLTRVQLRFQSGERFPTVNGFQF